MVNIIGASWFTTHQYCEYKFYLQKVLRIEVPKTQEMITGIQVHEEKEQEFLEEAEELSWKDFLESEKSMITKEAELEKQIGDIVLLGKIDEIKSNKHGIFIIDDKPNPRPYDSVKLQLYTYCFLFNESFKDILNKPIYAILRNRDTNEEVWQQEFNKETEKKFFEVFHRIRAILLRKEEPIPTTNPNKCRACIYHKMNLCDKSLAK
ncbi:MAG: PD-(D/E)XK nuclease family protein [Nanoarchaeota archaeon]